MPIPSEDKNRMSDAIEDAEIAFWGVIADAYPEATHGDFAPDAAMAMTKAMEEAVTWWLRWNADPQESENKTTEIMLHRIEYYYREDDELEITDGDEEHIAYCISQGISSGELCTIPFGKDGEVYGWWEINNNPDT